MVVGSSRKKQKPSNMEEYLFLVWRRGEPLIDGGDHSLHSFRFRFHHHRFCFYTKRDYTIGITVTSLKKLKLKQPQDFCGN